MKKINLYLPCLLITEELCDSAVHADHHHQRKPTLCEVIPCMNHNMHMEESVDCKLHVTGQSAAGWDVELLLPKRVLEANL